MRDKIVEEMKVSMLDKVKHSFRNAFSLLKVYADSEEGDSSTNEDGDNSSEGEEGGSGKPQINYEDLIAKARADEKNKQFSKIKKLEGEKKELVTKQNNLLLKIGELESSVTELEGKLAKAGEGDIPTVIALKDELAKVQNERDDLAKQLETNSNSGVNREELEKSIRAEIEEEYNVKMHRLEVISEHKDDLLVPELVTGTTVEDIDASLEVALERSREIEEKLGGKKGKKSPQKKAPSARTPKSNPTVDDIQDTEYSLEYIASLDPRSPEYAEVRKKMGLR